VKVASLLGMVAFFGLLLLSLGYHAKIKRRLALAGAFCCLSLGALCLLLAVTPGGNFYGPVLAAGSTEQKLAALTFDDGPCRPYTEQILDILRDKDVRATFFVVGRNALQQPEVLRRIQKEGHLVGTHTQNHKDLLRLEADEVNREMAEGIESIRAITGERTSYLRPPHGFKDFVVMEQAGRLGLTVVNWNVIPRDWTNPGVSRIVENVMTNIRPGAVILLHDGDSPGGTGSREQTVRALPLIIDRLREAGYELVRIDELQK